MTELTPERILDFYEAAARRMAGLPMCNPALQVALQGWQSIESLPCEDPAALRGTLMSGVLVTPWCMNLLVALPPSEAANQWQQGQQRLLVLASGRYELIVSRTPELGWYASGALVSMMHSFSDQPAVLACADQVLELILAVPQPEPAAAEPVEGQQSPRMLSRRALFSGFMSS